MRSISLRKARAVWGRLSLSLHFRLMLALPSQLRVTTEEWDGMK
jgi:hypothetical protein